MRSKVFIFLGVGLVATGMSLLQFAWYFQWYHNFEYGHEIGCIMLYTGLSILLAAIASALMSIAEKLEKLAQLLATKIFG